ncbi:integrase [Legionella antarctica]|uniref:Integrase n=1 Tax=Legionella antarctica TaxID=2708020 RepID=A0A6F8T1B2_9GAMM|nr:integrase arm-type DNA-binding domain-containing protein [Legionella antarctica]BCA93802.1 integrase [Legionella antarctica]
MTDAFSDALYFACGKTSGSKATRDYQPRSFLASLAGSDGKNKRHADRDGLVLEVRASGKKMFIFRFQWRKKPQTITLGHYPSLSLAEARNMVTAYREQIQHDIDPRKNASEEKETTLREAAELWKQKNIHRWRERTQTLHQRSLIRDIYPTLGDKPLSEIGKTDLLGLVNSHEQNGHHEIAHRLFNRLKVIFDFAVASGLTDNYPFIGLQKALAPKPRIKNQPAITPNEAHEMMEAVKSSTASKITKLYIELLSHLFTRPSELRLAQWSEFNLQQEEWHVPAERMKMAAPHWVPLSKKAIELLKELRLITGFKPYLFNTPSMPKPQPISETSARKLLHSAGYKDRHTLHGFRSLASSVLHERSSFRSDAIEAQLAHKVQGVRGVYLRADFKQERRQLMDWYSDWLMNCLSNFLPINKISGK